jgi:large subunit ribosomal protein L15
MKLHDLQPAPGSHRAKTRVGRGISAGKGKTAGRGTKGQKARAGGSIPPWFEGGQTPLHMRIPKLRGFKNRGKLVYEIVNVGDIAARIEAGAFDATGTTPKKGEAMTINADILRAVGLVRDVKKPLKILGGGELSSALFVVADAFTKSATDKIQAAGGTVNVLEIPTEALPALGLDGEPKTRERRTAAGRAAAEGESTARARRDADTAEAAAEAARAGAAKAEKADKAAKAETAEPAAKASKAPKAQKAAKGPEAVAEPVDVAETAATEAADEAEAASPAEAADAIAADAGTPAGDEIAAEAADALDDASSDDASSDDASSASSDESA